MIRVSIYRITVAHLALFALLVISPFEIAQQNIPDGLLRVTVKQRENGKLNPDYHIQELRWFGGNCSLIAVTLGSCRASPALWERCDHLAGFRPQK